MKIIFLLALIATMCTAFGQTPHSESFDVVKYVEDYVPKKMITETPPNSEFEKSIPRWKPGEIDGLPARVTATIPFNFDLSN